MKLTIITRRFPYFYTEAFLESEYPYLKSSFDELFFIPIFKGKVRECCRDARIIDTYNTLYSRRISFLKTLVSIHFYKSVLNNFSKILKKNFFFKLIHQDVHFRILREVINRNQEVFSEDSIIYSYWFDSQVYALLKLREIYGFKYKVITRAHRYDVYDEDGEMPNRAYCLKNIDKVYPISQDAIRTFTEKYGNNDKFVLARLGVKNPGILAKASLKSNDIHVLTVSQTSVRKRIMLVLETLKKMAVVHPNLNIYWTHFGDGPLDNELNEKVTEYQSHNFNVKLMGRVSNSDILKYYSTQEVDLFINLSSSEGVPVSVMEALSYGIPVIATDVGGTAEILRSKNGILLPANPTIENVINAYEKFISKQYDRKTIKDIWNSTSNAAVVFPEFVKMIHNL